MRTFDEASLTKQLQLLPPPHRCIFAASCALRLFPAYVSVHEIGGSGEPATLRRALDSIWNGIIDQRVDESIYQQHLAAIMDLMPSEEDQKTNPTAAYSEDALASAAYALRAFLTCDPQEAAWAARRVYEALDHLIVNDKGIELNRPGTEQDILRDDRIQAELERQHRDLEELHYGAAQNPASLARRFKARGESEPAV